MQKLCMTFLMMQLCEIHANPGRKLILVWTRCSEMGAALANKARCTDQSALSNPFLLVFKINTPRAGCNKHKYQRQSLLLTLLLVS